MLISDPMCSQLGTSFVQCDQDEDFLQISQKIILNITTVTDQEATHGPPPTSVGTVAGV